MTPLAWWLVVAGLGVGELSAAPNDPLPIVNGDEAGTCQFPTVTSMLVFGGSQMICSGTLIHPQVVLTAAHCILPESPIDTIGFGEHSPETGAPAATRDVAFCMAHPDWNGSGTHDVAFCMLDVPLGLEITPVLSGCEADALQPGQAVIIAGFGSTFALTDELGNITEIDGIGTKRYTSQTIHSLDDFAGAVNMVGPDGAHSACFGDSGGPAFVRMADGTWRVFGTGSQLFDPGTFPPPPDGNTCGTGVSYGNASLVVDWLETNIGFDITPCHDAAGTFTGGPGCGDFPTEIHNAVGDWVSGCVGGALGGGAEVCEPFAGPIDPDPTGGDDTTGGEDDGGVDGTGGEVTTDPSGTVSITDPSSASLDDGGDVTSQGGGEAGPPPEPSTTMPAPVPGGTGSGDDSGGTSSGGFGQDEDMLGRGCGCNSTTPRDGFAAMLLGVLGLVRARRRR